MIQQSLRKSFFDTDTDMIKTPKQSSVFSVPAVVKMAVKLTSQNRPNRRLHILCHAVKAKIGLVNAIDCTFLSILAEQG